MIDIIVIGGGAAGCMAALTAASQGASVLLMERNPKLGRKLYITGGAAEYSMQQPLPHQRRHQIPAGVGEGVF